MPKLYTLKSVYDPATDKTVARGRVFDATAAQAKQLDALKAARPATKAEIDADQVERDKANGVTTDEPAPAKPVVADESIVKPPSGAKDDPQALPQGKSG